MSKEIKYNEFDSVRFIKHLRLHKTIENVIVKRELTLNLGSDNRFIIKNCYFSEDVIIDNNDSKISASIDITNCICEKELKFISGFFLDINISGFNGDCLTFSGGTFYGPVSILFDKLNKINIQETFFKKALNIGSINIDNEHVIDKVSMFLSEGISSSNINFYKISIKDTFIFSNNDKSNANISFIYTKFNYLSLQHINNETRIRLENIKPINTKGVVDITSSDLNNCKFVNIDFRPFEIKIDSSNVTNIKSSNIKWTKRIKTRFGGYLQQRENYRQLKLAMLNQGDKIQALEFEKEELNAHYKSLSWKKDFWNKFILATNWTNNQGQSWIRPLLLLIGISILFYVGIKLYLGYKGVDCSYFSYDIGRFFTFLNPTHSRDFLGENIKLNNAAYLLDSSYRFVSAYLLFQLIKAFRKYVISR